MLVEQSEEERDTVRRVMTRNGGRLDYVKIISERADVCVDTREYIVHTLRLQRTSSSIVSCFAPFLFFWLTLNSFHIDTHTAALFVLVAI